MAMDTTGWTTGRYTNVGQVEAGTRMFSDEYHDNTQVISSHLSLIRI